MLPPWNLIDICCSTRCLQCYWAELLMEDPSPGLQYGLTGSQYLLDDSFLRGKASERRVHPQLCFKLQLLSLLVADSHPAMDRGEKAELEMNAGTQSANLALHRHNTVLKMMREKQIDPDHQIILTNPTLIPDVFSSNIKPPTIHFFFLPLNCLSHTTASFSICCSSCAFSSYRISCSFTTSLTTTTSSGDRDTSTQACSGMSARLKVSMQAWSRHSW